MYSLISIGVGIDWGWKEETISLFLKLRTNAVNRLEVVPGVSPTFSCSLGMAQLDNAQS